MGNDAIYTIDIDCTLKVNVYDDNYDIIDTIDGGYVKGVYRGTLNLDDYERGF
jgi:hypothetical protein